MVLILIVYALAVARLTRLINADTILDGPRAALAGRERQHRNIAHSLQADMKQGELREHHEVIARRWSTALYFVGCPWCVGLWLTLATAWAPLYFSTNPIVQYVGVALAASHLIGVFSFAADTEAIGYEDTEVAE